MQIITAFASYGMEVVVWVMYFLYMSLFWSIAAAMIRRKESLSRQVLQIHPFKT